MKLFFLLSLSAFAAVTNVSLSPPTATQQIITFQPGQPGACSLEVSLSNTYSPLIADVDGTIYTGAGTDLGRNTTKVNADGSRTIVIGKRTADDAALDLSRHSRALLAAGTYFYRICGTATGQFTTGNIPSGNTFNEAPFSASAPGQYNWPTIDETVAGVNTIYPDPQTGLATKRVSGPGTINPVVISETFSGASGTSWTCTAGSPPCSAATSTNKLYLKSNAPGIVGYNTPDWGQLSVTLASTTSTLVNLCLTVDGTNCWGSKIVTQVVTASNVAYTVGTQVPLFKSWLNGVDQPLTAAQVNTTNFGFLVWSSTATGTLTVGTSSWSLETSGIASFTDTGSKQLCSPVSNTVSGSPGFLCAAAVLYSNSQMGTGIWWINAATGASNFLGMPTFLCSNGNSWEWDQSTAGVFYCTGAGDSVIKYTYTGSYANVSAIDSNGFLLDHSTPSFPVTSVTQTGALSTAVGAFNSGYLAFGSGGWSGTGMMGKYLVMEATQSGQGTPCWMVAWDTQGSAVAAAISSYGGSVNAANRWQACHSFFTTDPSNGSTWIFTSGADAQGLPYRIAATGALTSTYGTCPVNTIQPALGGTMNCTQLTLANLLPANPSGGATLFGQTFQIGDYMYVNVGAGAGTADNEIMQCLKLTGLVCDFARAQKTYMYSLTNNHMGTTFALQPASGALQEMWMNFIDDPTGLNLTKPYGQTILEDPLSKDCHLMYSGIAIALGCLKVPPAVGGTPIRNGALPTIAAPAQPWNTTPLYANFDALFGGSTCVIDGNQLESHPSGSAYNATGFGRGIMLNGAPYLGYLGNCGAQTVTHVGTYLYRIQGSGFLGKYSPAVGTSGSGIAADVSPAVITDTTADAYKICYVYVAGDCHAASTVGDAWMNVPGSPTAACNTSRFVSVTPDICVAPQVFRMQSILQQQAPVNDANGVLVRRLGGVFSAYKPESAFWNARSLPDGGCFFTVATNFANSGRAEIVEGCPPAFTQTDSMPRNGYIPVNVQLPALAGSTNARALFGYSDYGAPSSYFCTARQVSCTTEGAPFAWSDETPATLSCASGCTVAIPAISQKTLYYAIQRFINSVWTTVLTGVTGIP